MKKIEVLGNEIKDYPLKELLKLATDGLNTPGVMTISWLSGNILRSVNDKPEQKEWLNNIDITICPDSRTLKSHDSVFERSNDGKSQDFIDIYFKYLSKVDVDIAIVADSEKRMAQIKKWIGEKGVKVNVVSEFIIDDIEKRDFLFNSLNIEMTKMVITCLPWPLQGELFCYAKHLSNSSAWLAILPDMVQEEKSHTQGIERLLGSLLRQKTTKKSKKKSKKYSKKT